VSKWAHQLLVSKVVDDLNLYMWKDKQDDIEVHIPFWYVKYLVNDEVETAKFLEMTLNMFLEDLGYIVVTDV